MKIAIPADEKNMGQEVSVSFGRAPYYAIFDADKKTGVFIVNTAADAKGGAGIKAAQIVVDSGAEVLLTPRCGENAAEVIKKGNVKIYKTRKGTIQENIQDYMEGLLLPLEEIHEGFHEKGNK